MFQTWAPYTSDREFSSFQLMCLKHNIRLERWLSGTAICELGRARLSPVHLEPLSWVDTYRCKEAILECQKQFVLLKAEYDVFMQIQREQGWGALNEEQYNTNAELRYMWLQRQKYMEARLKAANEQFPPEFVAQMRLTRGLTMAKALHPRVMALGTCRLSLLKPELLEHIFART